MSLYKKSYGGSGCKVRVYEPRLGADYMIAPYIDGKYHAESLGHRDADKAEDAAYAFIAERKNGTKSVEPNKLTIAAMVDHYVEGETFLDLKERQQKEKRAALAKIVGYFGPLRLVSDLDDDMIRGLLRARRKGTNGFGKAGKQTECQTFAHLRSVVRWAIGKKMPNGGRLLRENPIDGTAKRLGIGPNKTPMQPIVTHDTYEKLRRAARSLPAYTRVFLVLAEATGRRLSSMRQLKWPDVNFEVGEIHWREDADKMEFQMSCAVSRRVLSYLRAWMAHCPSKVWIFPAPEDARLVAPKATVEKWFAIIYRSAGLTKPPRSGWHSFRRKYASERDEYPIKDLMAAGGWKSSQAVMRYIQVDKAKVKQVNLQPLRRV